MSQKSNSELHEVILFKGSVDDVDQDKDDYVKILADFEVAIVPVLEFEYDVESLAALDLTGIYFVVVTSPRAVRGLFIHGSYATKAKLRECLWFVVGETTEREVVQDFGSVQIKGSESGNAETMIEVIREACLDPSIANGVFFCGNLRRPTVEDGLRNIGLKFRTHIIYSTTPAKNVTLPLTKIGKKPICIFFSPSGVDAVFSALTGKEIIIAIGQTTARALSDRRLKIDAVAQKPSPDGICSAIHAVIGEGR